MSKRKTVAASQSSNLLSFFAQVKRSKTDGDPTVKNKMKDEKIPSSPYAEALIATLVDPGWRRVLSTEFSKHYFVQLVDFLEKAESSGIQVFPPKAEIFAAFNETPFEGVKVVLIGQDPYHNQNQAHGLCFSVKKGVAIPPSLINMYKELETDIPGFVLPHHGNLVNWAKQGVLMLNATLTVQAHKANSHSNIGWKHFTDAVIDTINRETTGVVFLLLGNFAREKGSGIDRRKHTVVTAAHPSPFSADRFFGSRVFSKVNAALANYQKDPIDWTLSC